MTRPTVQPLPANRSEQPVATHLAGQVVYIYAFDVAWEMKRQELRELLGQPVAQFVVDASKRGPRQLVYYRPQMIRLPPLVRLGPHGPVRIERTVKLLPVGAISITISVPFEVQQLEDLVPFHDLRFRDGSYLYDEVRDLADEVRKELAPHYVRPIDKLGDEEAYTVFCIDSTRSTFGPEEITVEDWLHLSRRDIAALLTEESDPAHLSDQEAEESTGKFYTYYENDAVVIDWDAALVVDEPRDFDETLYIMELANLQLAELEAYDRVLDEAIEKSYRDLATTKVRFRDTLGGGVQKELRELRIDLARLSDELSNITKFFGDWHLARIYQGLSARFHLNDWHRTIDEKLKTLDDLYQLLRADQTNRWMLMMEFTIVLLILFEIVRSFFPR